MARSGCALGVLAAAGLWYATSCGSVPPRTTPEFDASPPTSIAIATPVGTARHADAPATVKALLTATLERRGWTLASRREADAVLRTRIVTWNYRAGDDSATVTIDAQLHRAADDALLWSDTGYGVDQDIELRDEADDGGALDQVADWVAGEVVQEVTGLGSRRERLREAASTAVAVALDSLPRPRTP